MLYLVSMLLVLNVSLPMQKPFSVIVSPCNTILIFCVCVWEQRVTLGSVENKLIVESECSMLLLLSAVAGFMGFGRGVGGSWVNVFSVRFSLFYVHFVFSCIHVTFTIYRPTQALSVISGAHCHSIT